MLIGHIETVDDIYNLTVERFKTKDFTEIPPGVTEYDYILNSHSRTLFETVKSVSNIPSIHDKPLIDQINKMNIDYGYLKQVLWIYNNRKNFLITNGIETVDELVTLASQTFKTYDKKLFVYSSECTLYDYIVTSYSVKLLELLSSNLTNSNHDISIIRSISKLRAPHTRLKQILEIYKTRKV